MGLTDAGLKELKEFKTLTELRLLDLAVTDAGLKELHGCKHLKVLNVRGTKVTDAGVAALKAALPACEIQHRQPLVP